MVKCWVAAAFLDAEKNFRRILGYRDLWTLKAVLNENQIANARRPLKMNAPTAIPSSH